MKLNTERLIFGTLLLIMFFMVIFGGGEKVKPVKYNTKYYEYVIDSLKKNIDNSNLKISDLYTEISTIKLKRGDIKKQFKVDVKKLMSITPPECDTVYVSYETFINQMDTSYTLEIKKLEGIISYKDSVILNYEKIGENKDAERSLLVLTIQDKEKEIKTLRKKKNQQIIQGSLIGFMGGLLTALFI